MKKSNKEYAREREADGIRAAIANLRSGQPSGGRDFDRGSKLARKLALATMRRTLSLTQRGVPRVPPVFSSTDKWFGSWPELVHGACDTSHTHMLWEHWSIEAAVANAKRDGCTWGGPDDRHRVHWKQRNPGTFQLLHGELFDTNVSLVVNEIDGHLVLFWDCVSAQCDWSLASDWIRRSFPNAKDAMADAMNFHNVVRGLRERT